MSSLRTFQMLIAAIVCVSCGKESDRPTVVPAPQMGDNLCNIAAPAAIAGRPRQRKADTSTWVSSTTRGRAVGAASRLASRGSPLGRPGKVMLLS